MGDSKGGFDGNYVELCSHDFFEKSSNATYITLNPKKSGDKELRSLQTNQFIL